MWGAEKSSDRELFSSLKALFSSFKTFLKFWKDETWSEMRNTKFLLLSESLSLHFGLVKAAQLLIIVTRRGGTTHVGSKRKKLNPFGKILNVRTKSSLPFFSVQQGRNSFFVVETQWVQKSDWAEWKTSTESSGGNFSFPSCLHLKIIFVFLLRSSFLFSRFWVCCCCRRALRVKFAYGNGIFVDTSKGKT